MAQSKLSTFARPVVLFDAYNRNHRKWFLEFLNNKSWGHCPVRFEVETEGDLVTAIQKELLQYYALKEFGEQMVDVQ